MTNQDIRITEDLSMTPIELLNLAISDPSRENFCSAFAAGQRELAFDDLKMAKILQVSRPTIQRWCKGETAPHDIGRTPIMKWMLHEVRKIGMREISRIGQEL